MAARLLLYVESMMAIAYNCTSVNNTGNLPILIMSRHDSNILPAFVSKFLAAFLFPFPFLKPRVHLLPRFGTADVNSGNYPHILNRKSETSQLKKGTADL